MTLKNRQRTLLLLLNQCPGFVGADVSESDHCESRVVIEPAYITAAMQWLKRRFHVNENLELSSDTGLTVEIKPRVRSCRTGGVKRRVTFAKPIQFELAL